MERGIWEFSNPEPKNEVEGENRQSDAVESESEKIGEKEIAKFHGREKCGRGKGGADTSLRNAQSERVKGNHENPPILGNRRNSQELSV